MPTTNHRERIRTVEKGTAGNGSDGLLAGIDEIRVDFVFRGEGADAEQTVFALQPHVHALGNMVGHERG